MAGSGGNMMQGIQNSGTAESGFGVALSGFHCPNLEVPGRLAELLDSNPQAPCDIEVVEQNGYCTVLVAWQRDRIVDLDGVQITVFRREPHRFFVDLPKMLAQTRAGSLERMVLTGSLGSVSLVLMTRPAPRFNG